MLDVRKLHMLAEVERLGTIAAAAETLHLTPQGVSMQLTTLEREVGLPLTERRGRRVALTPAGTLLARHGRSIVDQVGVAAMEVAALREGIAGTYRVAAFPTAARSFVAQAWRRLTEEPASGPALRLVELEPVDSLPGLAAGEVDLAVTHSYSNVAPVAHPGVETTQLAREEVFLAVPRTDSGGQAARLADYARADWIVPHHRWSCYEMIERACGLAGFSPTRSLKPPTSPPSSPSSPPAWGSPSWAASQYPSRSRCAGSPSPCTDTCTSPYAMAGGPTPASPDSRTCSRTPHVPPWRRVRDRPM